MPSYEEGEPSLRESVEEAVFAEVSLKDLDKRVHEIAATAWRQLPVEDAPGWCLRISMPFPRPWATPPRELVWYAYAERSVPGLVDGVEISQAWCRIAFNLHPEDDAEGQPLSLPLQANSPQRAPLGFEMLMPGFEVLGIQGVRPISEEELRSMARFKPGELLKALVYGQRSSQLKAVGRYWRKSNGCIFASLAPAHDDFAKWLDAV